MYVQYVFWLVRQVVYPVSLLIEFSQYIMAGLRTLASQNNRKEYIGNWDTYPITIPKINTWLTR